MYMLGFPVSSAGKESSCNAGDFGLIPGLGSFPGEGIGLPTPVFSWASLVVQMVKNPPAMWETGGGHGNLLQYSCLENAHGQGSLAATVHGVSKSQT